MADGFDDLQMVISLDASGVETGLNKVSQGVSKLDSDLAKLGTGAGFGAGVSAEADKAEQGLKGLGDEAQQTSDKLAKVGTGFDLSAFGAQLDNASSKMQSFGAGLTVLAAPFELVGALSVKAFSDFEAGMGKIFTLLPDISQDAMADMSQQIKEFSTAFAADISTIQQSAYDALSAGISGEDLFPFLETAQKAAIAGSSDVGVAVNGLTSAMNAYQMSVDESGRVSDVFFKTVELGKIEFDTLSDYIGKVTPTASALGVSLEDVGAGIAAITAVNPNASEAMTSLKSLFKDLATGGSDLDKLFQQLAGQSFKNFIASGGSLAGAMSLINDYMQQSGTDAFNLTGNFESANAIAMLTGTNFGRLAEFTDKVANSAGATDTAYEKMSGTLEYSLNALKSQFQVMSIEIGEKLAPSVQEFTKFLSENADDISQFAQNVASSAVPALEAVFDILKKGMDAFNGMSPETRSMLAKILGIGAVGAAVGGPALFAAGTALSPIASLVSLMGGLTSASTVATGALGGVSAEVGILAGAGTGATASIGGISGVLAALGPAGIAAAAGIAIAGAAYATNFGGFADNVNATLAEVAQSIEGFATGDYESAGKNAAEAIGKGFETVGDLLIDIIKGLPDMTSDAIKVLDGFEDGLKEVMRGAGEGAAEALKSAINSASISLYGLWQSIQAAWNGFSWSQLSSDAMTALGTGFNAATVDVSGLITSIKDSLLSGDWKGMGESAADLFVAGFKVINPIVGEGVEGFVDNMLGRTQPASTTTSQGFSIADKTGWTDTHDALRVTVDENAIGEAAGDAAGRSAADVTVQEIAKAKDMNVKDVEAILAKSPTAYDKVKENIVATEKATAATKENTEAVNSGTKKTETLEDATKKANGLLQESFTFEGKKYVRDEDTGQYSVETWETKAAREERARENKESIAQQKKLGDVFAAGTTQSEALRQTIAKYGESGALGKTVTTDLGTFDVKIDKFNKFYLDAVTGSVGDFNEKLAKNYDSQSKRVESAFKAWETANEKLSNSKAADKTELQKTVDEKRALYETEKKTLEGMSKPVANVSGAFTEATNSIKKFSSAAETSSSSLSKQVTPYTPASMGVGGAIPVTVTNASEISDIEDKYKYGAFGAERVSITSDMQKAYDMLIKSGISESDARDKILISGLNEIVRRGYGGGTTGVADTDPSAMNKLRDIATKEQIDDVYKLADAAVKNAKETQTYVSANEKSLKIQSDLSTSIQKNNTDYTSLKAVFDDLNDAAGTNEEFTVINAKKTYELAEAYKKASEMQDVYQAATSDSILTQEEQNDVSKKYSDILALLKTAGLDTTAGINGLPPALKLLYDSLNSIINGVTDNAAAAGVELAKTTESVTSSIASSGDEASDRAFEMIRNQFAGLKSDYESGKISQDQYLDSIRKLSAETDTLSRSTNILKGDQKDLILSFERNLKESLRREYAGTYGDKPIETIGQDIDRLRGIQVDQAQTKQFSGLIEGYKEQRIEQGKAAALQFQFNDAIRDGNVTLNEAAFFADSYNRVIGDNSDVTYQQSKATMDLMNTYIEAEKLNQLLSDAMLEGGISTEELAGIQAQQAIVAQDLTGVSGPVPAALQSVADAIDALMQRASEAASRAVASANEAQSAAEAKASGIVRAGQILKGPTPTGYASGGTVRKTGPALVHEGEYVLNRNDVNDIKRIPRASSNPVSANVNIDMRGATITKSVAQDIPRQVARAQRLALGRVGA